MTAITTIPFHGANLFVIAGDTPETTEVVMKPVVEGMGLDWEKQRRKLKEHPVLRSAPTLRGVQMPSDDQEREYATIPLNRFHFWLATINPNKVPDPQVRERVVVFQTDAADVLFDHFFGRAIGHGDDTSDRHFGISKRTISKVTKLEKVIDGLASQVSLLLSGSESRSFLSDYVSVHELLIDAKAFQRGRRRLNSRIGWELRDRALTAGLPSPCKRCPHTRVWLFQRDFAAAYMAERGFSLVADHNDAASNQGILQFPRQFRRGGAAA